MVAAALSLFLAPVRDALGFQRYRMEHARAYPAGLIARLRAEEHPPERVFNSFDWGGALLYELYPRVRVFIGAPIERSPHEDAGAVVRAAQAQIQDVLARWRGGAADQRGP